MSNIDPKFEPFMAWFAPKPDTSAYRTPRPEPGAYVYLWHSDKLDEPYVCHLNYTEPDPATDVCPGVRESMDLMYAYVRGLDHYRTLSQEDVQKIEEAAMAEMRREAEISKEPV